MGCRRRRAAARCRRQTPPRALASSGSSSQACSPRAADPGDGCTRRPEMKASYLLALGLVVSLAMACDDPDTLTDGTNGRGSSATDPTGASTGAGGAGGSSPQSGPVATLSPEGKS